jgi:hypothetical protein
VEEERTDTNDTSHDDWNTTFHHEVRSQDCHCRHADARFRCAIAKYALVSSQYNQGHGKEKVNSHLAPKPGLLKNLSVSRHVLSGRAVRRTSEHDGARAALNQEQK